MIQKKLKKKHASALTGTRKKRVEKICIKLCTKTHSLSHINKQKILPFVFNYVLREQNANNDNEFLKNPALYYQKKKREKNTKKMNIPLTN